MVTAQEGHRLSKLMVTDKENAFTTLRLRRQDSHSIAGHFLEYFYQQQ